MKKDEIKIYFDEIDPRLRGELEALLISWGFRLESERREIYISQLTYKKGE